MSEVSSLHDGLDPRGRGGRPQPPALATVYDRDEAMSTISSVSQQGHRRDDYPRRGGGYMGDRVRARSMDNLDDIGRRYPDVSPHRRPDEPRGRRGWVCVAVEAACQFILAAPAQTLSFVLQWTGSREKVKFNQLKQGSSSVPWKGKIYTALHRRQTCLSFGTTCFQL